MLTADDVDALMLATATAIREQAAAQARVVAVLEARVAAVETQTTTALAERVAAEVRKARAAQPPAVFYAGIWHEGETYARGSLVTRNGGLWLALTDHATTTPTPLGSDWKLIVKEGHAR